MNTGFRLGSRYLMVLAAALAVGACGDNAAAVCYADRRATERHWDCDSAKALAIREATGFTVPQADLDWYLDVYQRAFVPLEDMLGGPAIAVNWWSDGLVANTNAAEIVEPWTHGRVTTDVPAVDDILARAFIDEVVPLGMMQGPYFDLISSHVIAPQNVAPAFTDIPGLTVTAQMFRPTQGFSEVVIERPAGIGDAVDVVSRRGWGDCFVACTGMHFWRVRVTPSTAELVETWGDPIPPDVLAQWQRPAEDR